jgi:hypothetical protein
MRPRATFIGRDDIRGVLIDEYANNRNNCGTVAFCNSGGQAAGFSCIIRIVARARCRVVDQRAPPARAPARQHFLKLDTVFSYVLVYSGCSASRFPSARSD